MRDGEPRELERLTRNLKRLALAYLADDAGADDVVQEVWLASLRSPPADYESGAAWLRAVTRNLSRNERRKRARRTARELRAARPERMDEDPAAGLEPHAFRSRLAAAVEALADPYRSTVQWHFFEELSVREIARRTARPLATVIPTCAAACCSCVDSSSRSWATDVPSAWH